MTERHNTGRYPHRIRTRAASPAGLQWEVFQTMLGFAFTIQQEALRRSQPAAPKSDAFVPEMLAPGLPPALQRVASCAQNLTESSGAAIALGNAEAMICVARSGTTAPQIGAQFDARAGLSGECIRTGESAICVNAAADPRVNYQACRAMDIASMLYLPLHSAQGKLIGMLGVFASRPLHFSQRDLACLQFTEALVQEALNRNSTDPEPNALAGILRRADELGTGATDSDLDNLLLQLNQQVASKPSVQAVPVKPIALLAPEPAPKLEPVRAAAPPTVIIPEVEESKPEPAFLGRIVDESVLDYESEAQRYKPPRPSRIPLVMAAAVTLVIAIAGWNYSKFFPATPKPKQTVTAPATTAEPTTAGSTETEPVRDLTSELSIRSENSGATVTIALTEPITYEGYTISGPDRVYFDLHGLKFADASYTNFDIDSGIVSRVRVAPYAASTTRIVFDLRQPATFETKLEQNPKRLTIQLTAAPASPATATPKAQTLDRVPATTPPAVSGAKLTVVIDPGHGGRDTGTTSLTGLREKDVTLDIAQRLGVLLQEQLGANVVFTRSSDKYVSLNSRVAVANDARADFLISIHSNSSSFGNVSGVETFYFKSPQEALANAGDSKHRAPKASDDPDTARTFAADVQAALLHGLSEDKQPMRDRGIKTGSFVVLRDVRMPAVLAEVSFMSSSKDAKRLESPAYREQVASALFRGIASHVSRRDSAPSMADLNTARTVGTP